MKNFLILSFMLLSQNGYSSRVADQLMETKENLAQTYDVAITGDLSSNDSGFFKEFNFTIGHLFLYNLKTRERMKGEIYKTQITLPIDSKNLKVKVSEIDEYYGGGSIDTLIAVPFNYMNPNDIYVDTTVELLPSQTVVSGSFENDSVSINIERSGLALDGEKILASMSKDISGCHLERSIYSLKTESQKERVSCRNFSSQLYSISKLGFSVEELKEFILELDPKARLDRVEMAIRNINWYERNFVD